MASTTVLPGVSDRPSPGVGRAAVAEHWRVGRRPPATLAVAWVLASGFFFVSASFALAQQWTIHTRARDMGIYAQVMWNTAHGRPFASTLLQDNTLHVAEHVAPVLAVIAPLYALVPTPALLLLLQQACLAAAGLPLFGYARSRLGDIPALALLAGFYAMPALSRVSLSEFHPIVMAALPISLGVRAVLEGRAGAAVAWLVLALLFEEETAPLVGAAGAYLLLRHRRLSGGVLGALGTAWLLTLVLVVMPAFHDRRTLERVEGNRAIDHYDQVRRDPTIVLTWLFGTSEQADGDADGGVPGGRGRHAALWLLAPTLGLPLLAPRVLAIAAPSFALLFLADRAGNVAGHWAGATLPVYWFATAAGLARLARWGGPRGTSVARVGAAFILVAGGVWYWRLSYFLGGGGYDPDRFAWTDHETDLARAITLVSPGARVDATRRIVPQVANGAEVYQFPSSFYSAPMRPDLGKIDAFIFDLTDSPTRRALDPTDQDTVLTRRPSLHARTWGGDVILATRERPVPSRVTSAVFGGTLRLDGYDLERSLARVRLVGYWEATAKVTAWTRIAELVTADGRIIVRSEAVPLPDVLPPSRWERGQVVAETADLVIPSDLPTGEYRLRIGWLDRQGRPLPVADAPGASPDDRVEVAVLTLP